MPIGYSVSDKQLQMKVSTAHIIVHGALPEGVRLSIARQRRSGRLTEWMTDGSCTLQVCRSSSANHLSTSPRFSPIWTSPPVYKKNWRISERRRRQGHRSSSSCPTARCPHSATSALVEMAELKGTGSSVVLSAHSHSAGSGSSLGEHGARPRVSAYVHAKMRLIMVFVLRRTRSRAVAVYSS